MGHLHIKSVTINVPKPCIKMEIFQNSKLKTVSRGKILLRYGEVAKYTYKVQSGCLRSYIIDQSGKEHILQFAPEGWLVGDIDSSTNLKPSVLFIDALEDSEVLFLPMQNLVEPHKLDKEILIEMGVKLRNNTIATHKRIIGLLSATAKERYINFTETYPTLVQRLPLKLIASYIGITPEYLSDIRRKLAKK